MENKTTINPMGLINAAINKGMAVDQLKELFQLKKDFEHDEAKKAFFIAKTKFQFDSKPILKLNKGPCLSGKTAYKYATLDDIAICIKNNLANNNLTYRFNQKQDPNILIIDCIVTHIHGYSETTTVAVPIANISNKLMNSVQNNISIQTYIKRKALENALGLIIADEDIDGKLAGQKNVFLTSKQKLNITKLLKITNTCEQDLQAFNVSSLNSMVNDDYELVYNELNKKYSRQKLENNKSNHEND